MTQRGTGLLVTVIHYNGSFLVFVCQRWLMFVNLTQTFSAFICHWDSCWKSCNIQIWPLSCYFLQNLLMKTYFRGWLFNSQSTCFVIACHVPKKKQGSGGSWGSPFFHWLLEVIWACDVTDSFLFGFLPLQRVGEFSGKISLGCSPMFSWHSGEMKDNSGRGNEKK